MPTKYKMPAHEKARNRSLPSAPVVSRGRPRRDQEEVRSLPSAPAVRPHGDPPMTERRPMNWVPSSPIVKQAVKEPPRQDATPGRRRLRDIPRDLQRPLESYYASLRRHPDGYTDVEMSQKFDLHPDDLPALAKTYGQL